MRPASGLGREGAARRVFFALLVNRLRLRFNLKATLSKFFKLSVLLRKETLLPAFHALMRSSPLLSRKPPHAFGRRFPLPPPSFPQVTSQLCERIALSHFSVFLLSCSKGFTTLPTRNFSWKRSGLPQSTNTRAAQLEKRKKTSSFFHEALGGENQENRKSHL